MAMDPQLAAMLNQTVTWAAESASAVGTYGDPTWGSGTSIDARVVFRRSIVTDASGEEVASDVTVITESNVGIRDRLTLPGESTARQPKAIHKATDEDGTRPYTLVYL